MTTKASRLGVLGLIAALVFAAALPVAANDSKKHRNKAHKQMGQSQTPTPTPSKWLYLNLSPTPSPKPKGKLEGANTSAPGNLNTGKPVLLPMFGKDAQGKSIDPRFDIAPAPGNPSPSPTRSVTHSAKTEKVTEADESSSSDRHGQHKKNKNKHHHHRDGDGHHDND